ncbi:MAG: hypothetical protein Q8P33_00415, partial [bacterium]|nr:hypothetical protein [bacterium]
GLPGSGENTPGYGGQSAESSTSGFFNALLAGPYSAATQSALVLTRAEDLPVDTAAYISANAATISSAVIVGSLDQISAAVESEIASLF